jgi:hypothetical protein
MSESYKYIVVNSQKKAQIRLYRVVLERGAGKKQENTSIMGLPSAFLEFYRAVLQGLIANYFCLCTAKYYRTVKFAI